MQPIRRTLARSRSAIAQLTQRCFRERLTGTLLDRLTHHVHILEMNGES